MSEPGRAAWESAVPELFDFAVVAPRTGEDWRRDAKAVMNLQTADPRGWLEHNDVPEGDSDTWCDRSKPFIPPHLETFDDNVFPVSRGSALQLLILLHGDRFMPWGIPGFEEKKEGLLELAGTVVGRFGQRACFYTSATAARDDPEVDMYTREAEHQRFSDYPLDCGVIIVSPDEVGVFWSFLVA
ncbi:hypothetical protein [Streptomyces cacaoi]|uniref:hypothetical protein n=1 Tax=Streptomyces cacaoi TaxID=1898 RepID=UPI00331AA600